MIKNYDFCIVGGGFAGASTAYYLAQEGAGARVLLIEQEAHLGMHASGNNAAMLRQSVPDRAIARIATQSLNLLNAVCREAQAPPGFSSCGSLFIAGPKETPQLEEIMAAGEESGLQIDRLTKPEAVRKVPLLKEADFSQAIFCPSDGVIDLEGLLRAYASGSRSRGVTTLTEARLTSAKLNGRGRFTLELNHAGHLESLECKTLVNAAGAWSNKVAEWVGAGPMPIRSCRRHLMIGATPEYFDPTWPYVWDLSHDFYFRPYSQNSVLMSPCDQEDHEPVMGKVEVTREAAQLLKTKLESYLPVLAGLPLEESYAELRTLSSDNRFIIGPDPGQPHFFWISGLGGHGVTTSAGVGQLSARMLLGQTVDAELAQWFSPARFSA